MSALRKKIFSESPVKCVFLYGCNNSDSVIFENAAFVEIKDHSLRRKLKKKISMEVLSLCLPNVTNLKTYFQEDQLIAFVFMAQTSYCVDFRNAAFGGIKGHSLRTTAFQKKILIWKS